MKLKSIYVLISGLFLAACGGDKDTLVNINTEYGIMKVLLYEETPLHKENFLTLAREGAYDSTTFHRIIEDFMIQGGDITSKEEYDSEPPLISAELVSKFYHHKGALAAARQGDNINPQKKSSGSQFYIIDGTKYTREQLLTDEDKISRYLQPFFETGKYDSIKDTLIVLYNNREFSKYRNAIMDLKDELEQEFGQSFEKNLSEDRLISYTQEGGAPHLDDTYTVFGRVVEGVEVIDKIAAVPTGPSDQPSEPVYMTVSLEKAPKKEITKKYGYTYPE